MKNWSALPRYRIERHQLDHEPVVVGTADLIDGAIDAAHQEMYELATANVSGTICIINQVTDPDRTVFVLTIPRGPAEKPPGSPETKTTS